MNKIQKTLVAIAANSETDNRFDGLGVILAEYFDSHPDCPDEAIDSETGYKPWVMEQTDRALLSAVQNICQDFFYTLKESNEKALTAVFF